MQLEPKVNILLVDDQPENLLALEAILESLGENLVKATSGAEALRCLLHQDFAAILLDVQMPGMDGFETATLIRSRGRSRQTPIIFLTAFSSSDKMLFQGYALGAVDYLLKPLDPSILTSKVTVFVELYKKTEALKQHAAKLAVVNAELGQSEERFRLLSACSPVGIFETDTSGRYTYTNPRYQAICCLTLAESLEKGWQECVHSEDRERAIASWSAYTCSGGEYSQEFRFSVADGGDRWIHVRSAQMLSAQGELLGHVGTLEDITARKQAESAHTLAIQEQAARQEAEAANRMKDEFIAVLSHELRTPLNSMLGWSRLLRSKKLDESITARALETIERSATVQAQLIDDILDISRIIRGKLRLSCCPVNLVSVIEATMNAVSPQAAAKAIQLNLVLDGSVGQVWGDPARLQQIVTNLLTNAIKFTPENGKVEVKLSIPNSHSPTYAQIQVIDTGIGISPEFLPKIFDKFLQEDSSTTRSHNGLGLGLAIVRSLVEMHGGTVHAESPGEGQGSTFTVKIPLLKRASGYSGSGEAGSRLTPRSSLLKGLQVLVVDDEVDNRNFLTFVFEEHGALVTAVDSADAALAALEQSKLDILISDIGMPQQDGYALIQKVRSRETEKGGCIPAIALTAYSRGEDRTQALLAGFQQHLSKPVDPTELITAVASVVERYSQVSVI